MSHDPHLGFVIAAYALGLVIVSAMVVTILTDYRSLKRALASFAARERGQGPDHPRPDPESLI